MRKQTWILLAAGPFLVLAGWWGIHAWRRWRFSSRFDALVVTVLVQGKRYDVKPYLITDRARLEDDYAHMRSKNSLVFVLQNGTQIECRYFQSDGNVEFVPVDLLSNEVLGIGKDLWPGQ